MNEKGQLCLVTLLWKPKDSVFKKKKVSYTVTPHGGSVGQNSISTDRKYAFCSPVSQTSTPPTAGHTSSLDDHFSQRAALWETQF